MDLIPSIPAEFKLTPEFRLVIVCSWIAPPALEREQTEKIVSLCSHGINWDAFIILVRRHGVPSLAYTMLCQHAGERLPGNIRDILKADHIQAAGNSLFQAAELVRLIKLFDGHGIDLIPLKGVFLSHQLYGDMGVRSSVDVDILVKEEHIDRAVQILEVEGYSCDCHGIELSMRQKQHVRTHIHHYDFVNSKSGLHVELHWNVGPWNHEQLQVLLSHTTQREWQGMPVDYLDDDATLLLLCDHGARQKWLKLKWLGDVARLLATKSSKGWDTLLTLAHEVDLQRTLAHSALLVHWIYAITIPVELHTLIRRELTTKSLSESALKTLLMSAGEIASAGKRAHRLRLAWQMKRLRPSLSYSLVLKSCLVPIEDFQMVRLPASMFWLYYPLRPVLWFWRNYVGCR